MNFKETMQWIEEERDVIHCEECKYYSSLSETYGCCELNRGLLPSYTRPTYYCLDAERRADILAKNWKNHKQ